MSYSGFRRVITGHSTSGKAIIASDEVLRPKTLLNPAKDAQTGDFGIYNLFRTSGAAGAIQNNNVPFDDPRLRPAKTDEAAALRCGVSIFPPNVTAPMHRTLSVDLGVVLKGEVVLELEDGVETVIRAGECFLQRGTVHAWHNRTDEPVSVMFVLMPASKVKVEETGEELPERKVGE